LSLFQNGVGNDLHYEVTRLIPQIPFFQHSIIPSGMDLSGKSLLLSGYIYADICGIGTISILALKRVIVNFRGSRVLRSHGSFWGAWSFDGTFERIDISIPARCLATAF
jgi:hypothetical protein